MTAPTAPGSGDHPDVRPVHPADPPAAVLAAWSIVHGIATLALSGSLDASALRTDAAEDLLELTRRSATLLFRPDAGGPP